ncbi:MAG: D-ribose pyranase [Kineosporiaceae bacterium]|nr:D-ribose pyranase [Kineosporiaceae bacterium]MBK8076523.1 D-ribose pyranase [Kineosporiaceae bacterium]
MKQDGIIHAELSGLIARLGHTDKVVVADRGLPLPRALPVVDLALVPGILDFRTVLDALLEEIVIEAHLVATEAGGGPVAQWLEERSDRLGRLKAVPHEEFKLALPDTVFAIRTGEQTPYANVVLRCGVPF